MSTSISVDKSDSHEFRFPGKPSMANNLIPWDSDSDSDIEIDPQCPYMSKEPTKAELEESLEYMSGEKVPKLKHDEYLDYFPSHYVQDKRGVKIYTELIHPIKKKKPKATKKRDNRRFAKKREDLEDSIFRESEVKKAASRLFARAALSYLRERGHKLELVKPGLYEVGEVTLGCRAHLNFKAKREDDPSAPVETYFGQLCCYGGEDDIVVECCVSLGESDSLPYEPENPGCRYCTKNLVHHPLGGCKGIVWGLLTRSHKTGSYTIT